MKKLWDKTLKILPYIWGTLFVIIITVLLVIGTIALTDVIVSMLGGM